MEEEKLLPDVIPPAVFPHRNLKEPEGLRIEMEEGEPRIFTEEREISLDELFATIVGRNFYCNVEQRGLFDAIFKGLPDEVLKDLATMGEGRFGDYHVNLYGRDGSLLIRQGNSWGSLSNMNKLMPEAKNPREVALAIELASTRMARYGFPDLDFKSVGRVTQDLVMRHCRFQPRPPDKHLIAHLQSFKGARMEGVHFGTSIVYDYDIKSAFPSFVADLPGTRGMQWFDTTEILEDAQYAAILCDVEINDHLVRGPVAVRDGLHALYFPVGKLENVWLNKPEIDLLLENPDIGRILRVHQGSWGVATGSVYPYRRLLRRLYTLRNQDSFLGPYLKLVMAALWGKFISTYPVITDFDEGQGHTQSSMLYNPVFAAHVTSMMRCSLYDRSKGLRVVGEFIDGLSTEHPIDIDGRENLGDLIEKGHGQMVLFSDAVKACEWKNSELLDLAYTQRDNTALESPLKFMHTLKSALHKHGPEELGKYLGREFHTTQHTRLGSSMRFMGDKRLRVGDFLDGTIQSYPPLAGEIRMFRFMKGIDAKEGGWDPELGELLGL